MPNKWNWTRDGWQQQITNSINKWSLIGITHIPYTQKDIAADRFVNKFVNRMNFIAKLCFADGVEKTLRSHTTKSSPLIVDEQGAQH